MAFRDDREVLKQRAQDLERNLAEAESKLEAQKGEAERVKALEDELAEARGMLNRIEAKLPKQPSRAGRTVALVALAGLGAVAGGVVFLRGSPAPAPVVPSAVLATTVAPLPISVVTAPSVSPTPTATPGEPVKEVKAYWNGKAKAVTGGAIKPGAPCSVEAVLRSSHKHDVTVSCGTQVLYRSTDELNGMSQMKTGAEELPAEKAGKARALLVWNDVGARTGARTQASIDSQAKAASVWSETAPSFRVDIEIPDLSEAYEGTFEKGHSLDALPFEARVERSAKVTQTTGKAPIKAGASCRARLSPLWEAHHNCRVLLWCGSNELYGSGTTGYSHCQAVDGKPTLFLDDSFESDPKLTWDFAKGTITLVVKEADAEWSADFSVSAK